MRRSLGNQRPSGLAAERMRALLRSALAPRQLPPEAGLIGRLALASVAMVALSCLAGGCSSSAGGSDPDLVGAWQESGTNRLIEFEEDGRFSHLALNEGDGPQIVGEGSWRTQEGVLEIELGSGTVSWLQRTAVAPSTISWQYEVAGTTLTTEPAFGPTEETIFTRIERK